MGRRGGRRLKNEQTYMLLEISLEFVIYLLLLLSLL